MEFRFIHEFDCDVARYWRVFFDEDYNTALYKALGVHERRLIERSEDSTGATLRRVVRVVPKADLPAVMQKVTGGELAYRERSTFYRERNEVDIEVHADVTALRDRFQMHGVYSVRDLGDTRVSREFSGTMRVAIPILGGQIERHVVDALRKNYDATAEFTRRWLSEHP